MGWSIGMVKDTIVLSPACVKELDKVLEKEDLDPTYEGELQFNPDHSEHMDYLDNPAILKVLKKHQVNGEVRFASVEGDNAGSTWEHRFVDGKHECVYADLADLEFPV